MSATLILRDLAGSGPHSVALPAAAFAPACHETWLELYLRRGQVAVTPAALGFRILPRHSGFTVSADGKERPFTHLALRLHALSHIKTDLHHAQVASIEVQVDPSGMDLAPLFAAAKSPALSLVRYPLSRLLTAAASTRAPASAMPVFYLAEALARAERFARAGALHVPPIETGALLLGLLGSCPDSGEFYAVVTEALRIRAADAGTYHLAFTAESWKQIDDLLRRRADEGVKLLGQVHGHNFYPSMMDEKGLCTECALQRTCDLQTAHASDDDQRWMGAVFHRQPWQICQIFGLNARGEGTEVLCTMRDGRLQPRPYHVLDALPADFPWKGVTP